MNFIAELRKRNVFRTLAAYLVGSWIMVQVVGFIADAADMPPWTDTLVLILVLMGLPIVIVASWALELTPEGVKHTKSTDELEARPFGPVDIALCSAVVAVVLLFGWQMVASPAAAPSEVSRAFAEPLEQQAQSIAVMPFLAISDEDEDRILGDGLAEELLNVLAQFPELRVAGRTSSFAFRDQAEDIPAIGAALNVNHVLEGSVRRVVDQVRITAQLIRVSDGFHIWSGTYDRPFADIQEVQDDIVRSIAQTLTIRLGLSAYDLSRTANVNPAAYEQFLEGRVLWAQRHLDANRLDAIDAFQTAVDIDPDFANAWAALGRALTYSDRPEGYSEAEFCAVVFEAANSALTLDEDNPEGLIAMSNWHRDCEHDWRSAAALTARAVELAPNAAYTHYDSGILNEYLGNTAQMVRSFRRALALDPLNVTILNNAIQHYVRLERFGEVRRLIAASDMSELEVYQLEGGMAFQARDAGELRRVWPLARAMMLENQPELAETFQVVDHLVIAFAAAFEGDVETAESYIPELEANVDGLFIQPNTVADLRYEIGDYEEAARLYLELFRSGEISANNVGFASSSTLAEEYRCDPSFHALWAEPELSQLAEIRRENGAIGNLPLSGAACEPFLTN